MGVFEESFLADASAALTATFNKNCFMVLDVLIYLAPKLKKGLCRNQRKLCFSLTEDTAYLCCIAFMESCQQILPEIN